MMHLLIINSIIFTLLYFVSWKFFNPSKLYDELLVKEQAPEMEGDDFVNASEIVKKVNLNSEGRNNATKERFDELTTFSDNTDWITRLNSCWKPWSWMALLREYDDLELKKICGSDGALYIVYLRYSAIFFTLLSMGNGFLLFIYINGEATDLPNVM